MARLAACAAEPQQRAVVHDTVLREDLRFGGQLPSVVAHGLHQLPAADDTGGAGGGRLGDSQGRGGFN